MLKRSFHFLWLLLVVLLVLFAAALSIARWWVPEAGNYREEIEYRASQMLGKQVRIERMEASWRGLNPVIRLKNVQLSDTAGSVPFMRAREVRISIDVEHILAQREIRLAGVGVIGADFTVIRNEQGEVYLDGFQPDKESTLLQELLQMSLTLRDVNVTYVDRLRHAEPQRFSRVSMSLRSDNDNHSLTGHALLPVEMGYRADFEALLHGDSRRVQDWQGPVYIKGQSVALTEVLGPLLTDDQLIQGVADLRLWLNLGESGLTSVSGEIDTESLKIIQHSEAGDYRFEADTLRSSFGWRRHKGGWQFAIQDLLLGQQQRHWKTANLSLAGRKQQDVITITGVSSRVVLDGVGALLPIIPGLTVEQRRFLGALQPTGQIDDLRFSITSSEDATRVNGFAAQFSDLSIEQSGPLPKLNGLDGSLHGTTDAGALTLATRQAGIYDDRLFRELLPVDRASGVIRWQMHEGNLELATDGLTLRNKDLVLQVKAGLLLPPGEQSPVINLSVAVEHFDIGKISDYLPAKVMSARGVAWLDRSLKEGVVTHGRVVVNGRLDQIPFDNDEGILDVQLPLRNGILDYNEAWSPVNELDAMIDFSGRQMDLVSSHGLIRSAALEEVHAQIKDLANPVLTLQGDVQGLLPVMLEELGSSPLGDTYGGFVDRVTTKGDTTLGLDIVVPLNKVDAPVTVAGRIALKNNTLEVDDADIKLTGITGLLTFDDNGIAGEKLQAQLYGHPAKAHVWTDADKQVTNITLHGPFDLFNRFVGRQNLLGAATSGDSDWNVLVTMRGLPERGKRANIGITVTSTLEGTSVDLPAPFGKKDRSVRSLRIVADRIDVDEKTLRVNYGGLINGLLVIDRDAQGFALKKGVVTVGGGASVLPDTDILLLTGNVGTFNLSDWQPHFNKGGGGSLPLEIEFEIGNTHVLGYRLGSLSVLARSSGPNWTVNADGNAISGDVELTFNEGDLDKLTITMKRLALRSKTRDDTANSNYADSTPMSFPDLHVSIQQFLWDDVDLGLLEIDASKQVHQVYRIQHAALISSLLAVSTQGSWQPGSKGSISRMDVDVTDGQMDQLMDLFGYQKNIEGGTLKSDMQLAWPGPPWAFAPPIAEGKINVSVKNGQILDLEPGAAGRVLGLIGLKNLPRRLSLDFSDLFAEGFSFDEIGGSFVLDGGNAYTNDMTVTGPAAKIEISGRVGLADEDYDELVTVIPYIKTGLPLAGALAGGPAVGAVLLVAETLLKDRLGSFNRIAKKQYSVTGSWDDPVIEKLRSSSAEADNGLSADFE